jgi:hypothetical protein
MCRVGASHYCAAIFGPLRSGEAVYTASHLTIAAHPQGRWSQLGKAKGTPR